MSFVKPTLAEMRADLANLRADLANLRLPARPYFVSDAYEKYLNAFVMDQWKLFDYPTYYTGKNLGLVPPRKPIAFKVVKQDAHTADMFDCPHCKGDERDAGDEDRRC